MTSFNSSSPSQGLLNVAYSVEPFLGIGFRLRNNLRGKIVFERTRTEGEKKRSVKDFLAVVEHQQSICTCGGIVSIHYNDRTQPSCELP